ncbi:MAG: hypothetical protein Q7J85_03790 [Bacillota bacterium]|nr:hypothetical protein [Bacillota bacterium]
MVRKRILLWVVVTQDEVAYLNIDMIIDHYPELKDNDELEAIDSKLYKNINFINRQQVHSLLIKNNLGFDRGTGFDRGVLTGGRGTCQPNWHPSPLVLIPTILLILFLM